MSLVIRSVFEATQLVPRKYARKGLIKSNEVKPYFLARFRLGL